MKYIVFVLIAVAILGVGLYARTYLALGKPPVAYTIPEIITPETTAIPDSQEAVALTTAVYIENLQVPWGMVFTSPTRMLVTERKGDIRVIENGVLQERPIKHFPTVKSRSEEGLMGITLDPKYDKNKYIYVCLAEPKGNAYADRVIRLTDTGLDLINEQTLISDIPAGANHAGCRLKFGPDGTLYITTGDATKKELAQDKGSLAGKILRINQDGSIPSDNPFPNSPVWSFGHRNPQGLSFHPDTNALFITEHGPSGNDGPGGGDEINEIQKGGNFGWPLVSHEKKRDGLISPLITYTPAVAPASALFYSGDVFPQWKNHFFFGALRGEGLYDVTVSPNSPHTVLSYQKIKDISVGRVRDVIQGPDGYIYFSTSNTDGRGNPRTGDDKIYVIKPR